MKFTCLQENLAKGLNIVGKAISAKASLPVLANVLIQTDSGRIKLSATNLETAITTWVGASVEKEGAITVPARVLQEFVSNLAPTTITGEADGGVFKLSSDKDSSRFNGLDASEFPDIPAHSNEVHLKISSKVFGDAVLESAFAAAVDESRPVLTGVLVSLSDGQLCIVGVDGFRLAERVVVLGDNYLPSDNEQKASTKSKKTGKKDTKDESFQEDVANSAEQEGFSAVLPAKTLLEVARLVSTMQEPLEITLSDGGNLVLFKVGDVLVSSRVIDGDFPEYKKLIPVKGKDSVEIKLLTKDFISALRLANVFTKEASSVVKLKVDPKEGAMFVSSSNSELGDNNSRVDAEITGEDVEVAFNSKFILDALNNIKSEEFVFELPKNVGPGIPGVLRPVGRTDHTYLVMPVQI